MICTKAFSVVCTGQCLGLGIEDVWTENNTFPVGVTGSGSATGYTGSWTCLDTDPASVGPIAVELFISWNGIAGRTLRVTHRVVGSVTPVTFGNGVLVQARANAVTDSSLIVYPTGSTSPVDRLEIAEAATIGGVNTARIICTLSTFGTSSLSGEVTVACVE